MTHPPLIEYMLTDATFDKYAMSNLQINGQHTFARLACDVTSSAEENAIDFMFYIKYSSRSSVLIII